MTVTVTAEVVVTTAATVTATNVVASRSGGMKGL